MLMTSFRLKVAGDGKTFFTPEINVVPCVSLVRPGEVKITRFCASTELLLNLGRHTQKSFVYRKAGKLIRTAARILEFSNSVLA